MPTTPRIRGRRLQRIRQQQLAANPLCEHCKAKGIITLAKEVDHIKPLSKGGTDTPDNRQNLCVACHKAKTRRDMGYRDKPTIGLDGWPLDA